MIDNSIYIYIYIYILNIYIYIYIYINKLRDQQMINLEQKLKNLETKLTSEKNRKLHGHCKIE